MQDSLKQLLSRSQFSEFAGETARALQLAEHAVAEAHAENDPSALCHALVRLATVHSRFGQFAAARSLAQSALDAAPADSLARADALCRLGAIAAETNDLNAAEGFLRQALDLYRQLGSRRGLCHALHNLGGNVYLPRGQFALAIAAEEEASQVALKDDDPYLLAMSIMLTWAYTIMGESERAHMYLEQASALAVPHSWTTGYTAVLGAELALDEEDMPAALDSLQLGRSIADLSGEPTVNILLRIAQSRFHQLEANFPAATEWATDAVQYAQRVGCRHLEGKAYIRRAQVAIATHSLDLAERDVRSAVDVLTPFGAAFDIAHAVLLLAVIRLEQEQAEAEEIWLDAAQRIREGGYEFLLERERALAFPLIAAHLNSHRADVRGAASASLERLAHVPSRPLHIVGLGRFQVRQGCRDIPERAWTKRKSGELFRYLLLQPRYSATREQVCEALWPGTKPESVQPLFHQATSMLRRVLEPDLPEKFQSRYLNVEADCVALLLPAGSTIDFESLEREITCALEDSDWLRLRQALTSSVPHLFPGDLYTDWSAHRREQLAELYVRGLVALARAQLEARRPTEVLDLCRRILEREPWHEDAVLLGMRACLALGDRPRALRLYQQLTNTLAAELNLTPRADLQALAKSLRTS